MLKEILQKTFLQNRILDYATFLLILIVGIILIKIIRNIVLIRLKKWTEKTTSKLDDFLIAIFEKTLLPLLYFGIFYLSVQGLTLNTGLRKSIDIVGIILLTIFAIRFLVAIISYSLKTYWLKKEKDKTKEKELKGILTVIKVIIWGLGVIFLLDNFGFKISSVIAGLGIGGVAVALAAQTILGDLFSYFAIFFDKPFEIGDFIIVDEYLGTIEHIGIKTTRVRSLGGEQLIFSNKDLTNSRVRNYKRMQMRRVVFRLGVIYQTTLKQVKEIPEIIRKIIEDIKDTTFDRAHFFSFGDFSLVYEVVYYIHSRDYNKYMDIQQEINLAIKAEFEKRKIEFAYPTQTLYVNK